MDSNSTLNECALCGNPIRESSYASIKEKIGGTSYEFDTKDCAVMFKRFHAIYGDEFEELSGLRQHTTAAEQKIKVKGIVEKEKGREKEKEKGRLKKETPEILKIAKDPKELLSLTNKVLSSAREKIQVIFSSPRSFNYYYRYQKYSGGGFQFLDEVSRRNLFDVEIISPSNEKIKAILSKPHSDESPHVQVRYIQGVGLLDKDIMLMIVDGKQSLAIKLKEPMKRSDLAENEAYRDIASNKDNGLEEAIELGTYSNNKSVVLSYAIVFETLWRQLELNEQISSVSEKLRAQENRRGDVLSIAAHELRDPIQPVLGLAEILQSNKTVPPQEQEEFLAIIVRNAKRLKALTENILDLTRIEKQSSLSLNKELIDIRDIIQLSISDFEHHVAANNKIEIEVKDNFEKAQHAEHISDAMIVQADRSKLMQVISNLLSNAAKFTEAGKISISIEKRVDTDNSNKHGVQEVIVSIIDSGPGIEPSMMTKLFEKFSTKSGKGTGLGLGLFISKNIITSHGGKIWAENNPGGKGAKFAFALPLAA